MSKISGVYLIRNTITNDCYVGSSTNVKKRWANHKCLNEWKKQPNNQLYIDMQAIGKDKFSFKILEECDKSSLRVKEQYYIKKLKPIYNSFRAFRTPEEYKEQHNEAHRRWRELNREKARATSKRWRERNKAKTYEISKKWRQAHKEQTHEASRRWRKNHPERAEEYKVRNRETSRRWKAEHSDYMKQYMKQYYLKRKAAKQVVPET